MKNAFDRKKIKIDFINVNIILGYFIKFLMLKIQYIIKPNITTTQVCTCDKNKKLTASPNII